MPWTEIQPGVYDCRRGTDVFRILVAGELPRTENNALLHLFSAAPEQAQFGAAHYKLRTDDSSTLLGRLFAMYRQEGLEMPYTIEDFRRDYVREHLKDLTPQERLKDLGPEERLEGLSVEDVLRGLTPEQIAALQERLRQDDTAARE